MQSLWVLQIDTTLAQSTCVLFAVDLKIYKDITLTKEHDKNIIMKFRKYILRLEPQIKSAF